MDRFAMQQPSPIQVASPMNDNQLVALVAAQLSGSAEERVTLAMNIVAETVARNQQLPLMIQRRKAGMEELC
jgi:hypothetical protein